MKCRVAVLFGGQSSEHEVSLRSAASILHALDSSRYEPIPIGIDKQGQWLLHDLKTLEITTEGAIELQKQAPALRLSPAKGLANCDVVFPAVHGTFYEDGCLQGLLELLDIPYVGAGVLGSAVGMNKIIAKRLAQSVGVPVADWDSIALQEWQLAHEDVLSRWQHQFTLPVFVKPVNGGSSVGVSKVKSWTDLVDAVTTAYRYDDHIIIERAIDAREIEVAVLENTERPSQPHVSLPSEVKPTHEFYSYTAKYLDPDGAHFDLPAQLPQTLLADIQQQAATLFQALHCQGMARVDFLVDRHTNVCYFNELNTLPGFTAISLYPKMWEMSGLAYPELLTRLIELAMARHRRQKQLVRDFTS